MGQRIVLILILMEHAQRDYVSFSDTRNLKLVLILILMEHAQRGGIQLGMVARVQMS